MREIAKRLVMSVSFVHKWCRRLAAHIHDKRSAGQRGEEKVFYTRNGQEGIREAIRSESKAPKEPHRKITTEHKAAVIEFRHGYYARYQGPQKIRVSLGLDISHQSIYAILALEVRHSWSYEDVEEILERTIRMFGPPLQILSDHGTQWCAVNGGISRFDTEFCRRYGTEHIMGKVRKPTTHGKIERWHGTIKKEAHHPPKGSTLEDYEKAIQLYMGYYNFERPHHGICLRIPFEVYMGGLTLPEAFTGLGVHEVSLYNIFSVGSIWWHI